MDAKTEPAVAAAAAPLEADFTADDLAYASSAAERDTEDAPPAPAQPQPGGALVLASPGHEGAAAVAVPALTTLTNDQYQDLKQTILPATSRSGSGSGVHGSDDESTEDLARRRNGGHGGAVGQGRGSIGHSGRSMHFAETFIAAAMTPHGSGDDSKYQKLFADYKKLQTNFEQKVAENKSLTAELDEAKLLVAALFTHNANLRRSVAVIQSSYAAMEKDSKKMARAYDELKEKYAKLHKVFEGLLDENKKLTGVIKELQTKRREQEARIKTLMKNAINTSKRLTDLEGQHKQFQIQKADLEATAIAARTDAQELLVGEVGLQFERAVVHHVLKDNNRTAFEREANIGSIIQKAAAAAANDAKAPQLTAAELARWNPISQQVVAVWGNLENFCNGLRAVKRVRLRKAHNLDGRDALSVAHLRQVDHIVSAQLGDPFIKGYHVLVDILAKLLPEKPMQSLKAK